MKNNKANTSTQPQTWLDRAVVTVGNRLSLLFLLGVAISLLEVILRYLFNAPTAWAHETTVLLCALCFLYGGAHCLAQDSHIRITVVYNLLNKKVRRVLDFLGLLLCGIYLAAMTYAAWFVARSSLLGPEGNWQPETSGSAWDPAIPALVRSVMFVVLLLMCLQVCLQLGKRVLDKRRA